MASLGLWLATLMTVPETTRSEEKLEEFPDGVCYPVNGSAFIVPISSESRTDRVPVGPFTALVEGDSLVVEKGTITFIDFRNGQRSVFGAGTAYRIPRVVDPDRPKIWGEMKKRLRDVFRGAAPHGRESGATRDPEPSLWPDGGVEFAPDVPIVLTWSGVTTKLSIIRINAGDFRVDLPPPSPTSNSGEIDWVPGDKAFGPVEWSLLDVDGEPLLTGRFEVLTLQQAEEKRKMYRARAAGDHAVSQEMGAILRALADRSYLW